MANKYASKVVNQARAWLGCKEADGTHRQIIDVYNGHKPLARGYAVTYTDAWCATFVSACSIVAGCTDILPTECGCNPMINLFKNLGEWVENDAYVPSPGDVIFYDWEDSGNGDNVGSSDHVGIVESCDGKTIIVIEGNKSDSVSRRTLSVNGRYIRGYGVPKYDKEGSTVTPDPTPATKTVDELAKEVIAGKWGNGDTRKAALTNAGYDYSAVQNRVNEILKGSTSTTTTPVTEDKPKPTTGKVTASAYAQGFQTSLAGTYRTTAALNMRDNAGTSHKILTTLAKGTLVKNYGYFTSVNGVKWLYVQVTVNGVVYTGFCSSGYLQKV